MTIDRELQKQLASKRRKRKIEEKRKPKQPVKPKDIREELTEEEMIEQELAEYYDQHN